jgi:cation diffusion facilitator family transporter
MDECCDAKNLEAFARRAEQRTVLKIVLAINATLFVAELMAGIFAGSTALLGDSLDMLGDAMVYGFSLYVLERSERLRTQAALLKGAIMAAFGAIVVWQAVTKMIHPALPAVGVMGLVGLAALAGNGVCFWLLYRHRTDDLNMRSTWLCSRNDLIANTAVIGAAIAVEATGTAWPDVLVGLAIAALFLSSAFAVLRDSTLRLRELAAT